MIIVTFPPNTPCSLIVAFVVDDSAADVVHSAEVVERDRACVSTESHGPWHRPEHSINRTDLSLVARGHRHHSAKRLVHSLVRRSGV